MALKHYQSFPSSIPLVHTCHQYCYSSKPHLFVHVYSKPPKLSSLSATSPTSSNSIFLPLLEEAEQKKQRSLDPKPDEEQPKQPQKRDRIDDSEDPIVKFFKSYSTTKDPPKDGRTASPRGRGSAWHLAPAFAFASVGEAEIKTVYSNDVEEEKEEIDSDPCAEKAAPSGVVAEILQIARNLPENTTLGECLGHFEKRVNEEDCAEALSWMGQEGLVRSCLYFFEWMGLQEPSLITTKACTVLFPLLGSNGMGDKVMPLFQNLPKEKKLLNVQVYGSAMSGLLYSGRYKDAWKVNEAMETNNIHPNCVTCSIVMTLMRKSGRSSKEAWQYFKKMDRRGIKWGPEVLGALIKSFCDEGLTAEALIVVSEMEKKGVPPNTVVYTTLMDAYVRFDQIEEAEGLLAEMKAKGLEPSTCTYNILIHAYSKRMQPEIVENLLVEMKDIGLEPNARSYTPLIGAYGRQKGMSDRAADVFLRMNKAGIKPTSHSYTALIHAYAISRWHEKAYFAFENMRKEGIKPAIETYTALLDAYRREGDTEMLMKIWKMMLREKVEGTHVTFNTLVDGFAKQGHYIEARDVIFEFGKMGFQPTVLTYNMLMNAYARGGQESKLPQLLKEMANLNLKPNSSTYSTIIYAYIRVRDFKWAFFYHKEMVKSGQVPDRRDYEKLRSILAEKAATKNRKDRRAILGIVKSQMGMVKVKKKAKKDELWKTNKRYVRTSRSSL